MIHIYVDADACPVKAEIVRVATRHKLRVFMVSNSGMRPDPSGIVENVIVGAGFDEADNWIAEQARANDIVVTADMPLAARCVTAGARVIGPTGRVFDSANIGPALAMRDLAAHLRATGESKGYNASFSAKDRSAFLQALDQAVTLSKKADSL